MFAFPVVWYAPIALSGLSIGTLVLLAYLGLSLAAGIGLLMEKEWGRISGIVHAALSLLWFPIGTVIGIITLIYLTKAEVREYFESARK